MKKWILVEFPDDFIPPEKFDGTEEWGATYRCENCPFYTHDIYDPNESCCISEKAYVQCPIREFFLKTEHK